MARSSIDEFLTNTARKETLVEELEALEEDRIEAVGRVTRRLGMNERDMTLTKLSSLVDELRQHNLKVCQKELVPLVADIKALNARNKALLDSSISLVRDLMNFVNLAASSGFSYEDTGHARRVPAGGRLFNREG